MNRWTVLRLVFPGALWSVPVVALRFRFNALQLGDLGSLKLGVDPSRLRLLAMACGVVLLVISQVQAGPVFPLALVVEPLARRLFGFEFRWALAGSALIGACALLLASLPPVPLWVGAWVVAMLAEVLRRRQFLA